MKMKKWLLLLLFVASASVVLAASNFAAVQNKIEEKTNIQGLQLREQNGGVLLEGLAYTLEDKAEAEKIATDELKTNVVNHIGIKSAGKSDQEIIMDVVARIKAKSSRSYQFSDISVNSKDGRVILQGSVREGVLAKDAEKAAMEVPGVRSVENRIEVLPVSTGDERIRSLIYQRLSNDDRLRYYLLSSQPSIRILVKNARVTLTGSVHTDVDKRRAGLMAREVSGTLSVDNQLRVE